MKKPMRKVKKFNEGGSSYTGDDEIVKYRMGQIKDPGIDLFKLTSGEAQEAKPVPLAKKAEPAETKPAAPAEPAKIEVKTTSEDIFDETGTKSKFKRNQETGELYTLEDTPKPVKPVAKKAASSSSTNTSSAKPAEKTAKAEPKAETKTKTEPKKPYDSNEANAAIKAQSKLDSEYTPPKPPPSPGRLGFKGDFFSGRPYGADKFEKEQRSKRSMAAEGNYKKGGSVKMASGGKVSSASKRADGCALRGKTRA